MQMSVSLAANTHTSLQLSLPNTRLLCKCLDAAVKIIHPRVFRFTFVTVTLPLSMLFSTCKTLLLPKETGPTQSAAGIAILTVLSENFDQV